MPECRQRVLLLSHTPDAQALIALGARLCYAGGNVDKLMEKVSRQDQQAFLEKLMSMGHESVLEHVSFTFLVEGVSRVLLAQLTALIFACPGVANCTVAAPAADVAIQADELPVLGTLTVEELT